MILACIVLKHHLLNWFVTVIQKFRTLSVSNNSRHKHSNVHMKQAYRMSLQKRQTRMMKIMNTRERNYESTLPYDKGEVDEMLERKNERSAKAKWGGPYLLRDEIRINMNEIAGAADASVQRVASGSFTLWFVTVLKRLQHKFLWQLCVRKQQNAMKIFRITNCRLISWRPDTLKSNISRRLGIVISTNDLSKSRCAMKRFQLVFSTHILGHLVRKETVSY